MEKGYDESHSEGQQVQTIMLEAPKPKQHKTNRPAIVNTLEAKKENYARRQHHHINDNDDDNEVYEYGGQANEQRIRCDEVKQQQRLKKRNFQKLRVKCENYENYDLFKIKKSINRPSASSITPFSYNSTPSSSSASSLSSESVSSNTATFINCSKKDKNSSAFNNNCNNQTTYHQQHNHKSPSKNIPQNDQQQMLNCEATLDEKSRTASILTATSSQPQQHLMQYNQQVKCHRRYECNTNQES